ncbi:MAG: hypothetical protein ABI616_12100 [Pseudomonadota bacterium]
MKIDSLRELPQSVAPSRDLWPGIESGLGSRRRTWAVPASLAAALVLVVLGFVIGNQTRNAASSPAMRESGAHILAALMTDPGYQGQREELLSHLPAKLERLPPTSRQRVTESLLAIHTAMKNIEAELGRDAGNALLQELLISTCQEEIRVLTAIGDADGTNQEI